IPTEEPEDEPPSREEQAGSRLSTWDRDTAGGNKSNGAVSKETEGDGQRDGEEAEPPVPSSKARKKKKKRKPKKTPAEETLHEAQSPWCWWRGLECEALGYTELMVAFLSCFNLFRNLNPENELKRYFGARAVLGDQRPRQRQRQYIYSTWLTTPKNTWPRYSRTGMAMKLLETRGGAMHFTFEHHREYQQVQFKFLDAVESMDPNNIVLLLQMNPYHVDSLLQLSDMCRMQEDQEMARDLIERALYSLERTFHPVFSLTRGISRLDYRRPAFFLALFKHLMFLEKRGCPRTALEFCKLILNLDPENDPLCVLLLIDFLSLRARKYSFLTCFFEEWESHRNLSQLPNFAFSVPLAYFFLSQQEECLEQERGQAREKAARLIQLALVMFPSVLMPLLDRCSVQPDARVASHPFFGLNAQISQPPALNQLTSLYVGRTYSLWKDLGVMAWLETNVHEVLRMVDARDPLVEERKTRYQSAPRNIYRHIILSEIKEATAALPLEVTSQPVMGFDPLPPLDSIISYTRPER
ncbi:Transcription factor 25, partial [Buceros rhinoceros silvestris]